MALATALPVYAATTIIVTPANTQGWSTADTRPGGTVTFVVDPTSPAPNGALQLTTDATTTAKAQYLHNTNTSLSSVVDLSYYTKQVFGSSVADPAYQLVVCLNGVTSTGCKPNLAPPPVSSFTTLVFEPYQNLGNNGNAAIVPNVWQKWNVSAGLFWSTRTVTCSNGVIAGTPGGPASYTLAQIKAVCPDAVVVQYGINIGSNNPSYVVRTDLFNFNGTIYNFEVTNVPTDKKQCKSGGYVNYTDANGNPFANQGQCIAFVEGAQNKNDNQGSGDNNNSHND